MSGSNSPHPSNSSYSAFNGNESIKSDSSNVSASSPTSPMTTPVISPKTVQETKKTRTIHIEDDTDSIVDSLQESQRNLLLVKYAETNPSFQTEADQLLKKFCKRDHHVLLEFMKANSAHGNSKIKQLLGKNTNDSALANQAVILEYKKFWYEENRQLDVTLTKEESDHLRKLISYVPKLVARRLVNNATGIKCPEIEHYPACVVFADVSGFTALTDKLASLGPEGVEKLTNHLNTYFDALIGTIYRFGGDIVKFAGDAILCVWPADSPKGLGGMILLACQCAKTLLHDLNEFKVPETDCVLRLHIGIGAGEIGGVHVGGVNKRSEFFISGQVLEQVSACEKQAQPGEVYVSAVAWLLVDNGSLVGVQKGSGGALANYRLDSIKNPLDLPPPITLPLYKDMEESLKTYIPPAVLRNIASDTKRWLAELRTISVIFLNLTSPFKEEKLPELQTAISEMQEILNKYEGVLRQFMIDDKGSVLIIGFGVPPLGHEDDPRRAVETALDIFAKLQQLKVPCSIGVTTGKAFCGDVGSSQRREYAMVGDIVNLSARLMAAAKTGILCDSDTYEAVKYADGITFEEQKPIKVKGKPNPITTYIPKRNKKQATTNHNTLKNKNLMATIGRDTELKLIQKHIKNLSDNQNAGFLDASQNACLIIEGEAGVGKSRLVFEVVNFAQKLEMKTFTATGSQLQNSTPYHAWQSMFETVFPDGKVPDEVLSSISSYKDYLPLLSSVLPLKLEETPKLKQMNPEERSELTQQMLIKVMQKVIKRGSCIVLENAQWFDSNSWAVTLAVIQQMVGILIVISTRPIKEGVPFQYSQIKNRKRTKFIQLQNLTEDKTEDLISAVLQIKKIPEKITKDIHKKSQGNPFVTEAIVTALRDSGSLQITKTGDCVISGDTSAVIPNNLAGLLTSKVDRLSPNQQILLKVGSVIGQTFTLDMLGEVLYASKSETAKTVIQPSELKKDLQAMVGAGLLILESPDPNLEYSFANSLIRDVVYDLMLYSQKRQVHRHIVSFYREHFEGRSPYYPLIAHHLKQAEEYEGALEYFVKAGSTALLNYANKEAVTFFTEALNLINKLSQTDNSKSTDAVTMERKLGQAYYSLGQIEKAGIQFRKVLDLLGLPVDDPKKIKVILSKGVGSHSFTNNKKGEVDASEKHHRKREAVIALLGLTRVNVYQCNKILATQCAQLALEIAPDTGSALNSESLALNALICGINSENDKAQTYIAKGLEVAGKHLDMIKDVEQMAAMYHVNQGKWDDAELHLQKAIELAKTVGNLKCVEESSVFLGAIYYFKGDLVKSTHATQQAMESSSRGDAQVQMLATNAMARNLYAIGDFAKCLACLKDVKIAFDSVGKETHDTSAEINFYALNGLMYLRRKELQQTWIFAETVFNILGRTEPTAFFTFMGYFVLPEIYIRLLHEQRLKDSDITLSKAEVLKKAEKAVAYLQKFAQVFAFALPRLHLWTGALRFLTGKSSKAEQEWTQAISIAKSLGLEYEQAFVMFMKGVITKNGDDIVEACNKVPEMKSLGIDITTLKLKLIKL